MATFQKETVFIGIVIYFANPALRIIGKLLVKRLADAQKHCKYAIFEDRESAAMADENYLWETDL